MPGRSTLVAAIALGPIGLAAATATAEPRAHSSARQNPCVLAARGILASQRGDLAVAVSLLRRAVGECPDDLAARHHLGLALLRRGELRAGRRVLAAAVRLSERPGRRLLLDLGLAYLAEDNYGWAVRTLRRAAELAPRDGQIRYHLAVALLRQGEAPLALEELDGARRLGGVERESIALQAALAHYTAGRWADARRELDGRLLGPRGAVARQLMRATHEAEGDEAALVDVGVASGGVVDSNPLFEHETSAPTAVGVNVEGWLALRPWVDAQRIVSGEARVARVFYFAAGEEQAGAIEVSQVSRTDLQAAAAAQQRLRLFGRTLTVAAGYRFGITFLDAPPALAASPTLVDDDHIFTERHAGHASLRLTHRRRGAGDPLAPLASPAQSTIRYAITRQAYADLPRSNLSSELLLEHGRAQLDGRLRLLGWLGLRHQLADASDYDALIPGAGVAASYVGPLSILLGARLGYEYEDHYRSADSGRWGQTRRRDHTLAATAELSRALPWNLRLAAVYQRLQKLSTVQSYDYGRDLFSLTLSWSYR